MIFPRERDAMVFDNSTGLRLMSATLLLLFAFFVLWLGGWMMVLTLLLLWIIALYEWQRLVFHKKNFSYLWLGGGGLIISLSVCAMGMIVFCAPRDYSLWLFLLVVVFDSGSWLGGRLVGMVKLMPSISPHKTWEGLLSGVGCVFVMTGIFMSYNKTIDMVTIGWHLPLLLLACVLGDGLESFAKRRHGVKDSGRWIKGHGGLLDRMDALGAGCLMASFLLWMEGRLSCAV